MTLEEFHRLPLLLTRRQVLAVTGWCKKTFYKQVDAGQLKPALTLPTGKQFFRKRDFEALV